MGFFSSLFGSSKPSREVEIVSEMLNVSREGAEKLINSVKGMKASAQFGSSPEGIASATVFAFLINALQMPDQMEKAQDVQLALPRRMVGWVNEGKIPAEIYWTVQRFCFVEFHPEVLNGTKSTDWANARFEQLFLKR